MINELKKRVLVLDGATGTAIQKYNLTDEDFQGKKGCNEILNITRPDVIKEIHTKYIEAGADIIETNSFNCNRIFPLLHKDKSSILYFSSIDNNF